MENTDRQNGGHKERGAVSIFLVVFFALFLGVITIGFINIIVRDSQQAVNGDLSQSAYDSAQAGVEDTKRAIALYTNACLNETSSCASYRSKFNENKCDTLASPTFSESGALGLNSDGSSVVIQNDGSKTLDQAYTCVKVDLNTPDYIGNNQAYTSDIIPLNATGDFDAITLKWFVRKDAGLSDSGSFSIPNASGPSFNLPKAGDWSSSTPSVLRVELISYSGAITNAQLMDDMRTVFLYPSSSGITDGTFDINAVHRSSDAAAPITAAHCENGSNRYACEKKLSLGGLGSSAGKKMFLRVTPIYGGKTTFNVSLNSSTGTDPLFDGVQPLVDSTGRANDLFRRVQARVRMQASVLYPEYAVDVQNDLCKTFSVGTVQDDFKDPGC